VNILAEAVANTAGIAILGMLHGHDIVKGRLTGVNLGKIGQLMSVSYIQSLLARIQAYEQQDRERSNSEPQWLGISYGYQITKIVQTSMIGHLITTVRLASQLGQYHNVHNRTR